jgi:mannose-6-phosphate isomerase-like protein (cupin superfamily)
MNRIEHFITRPLIVGNEPHHDNERAYRDLGPRYKYIDNSIVPEGDITFSVREIKQVPADYKSHVQPHRHEWSEVYAVISDDLTVEYTLGEETCEVKGRSALFVPPGELHSYRPVQGSGYIVFISRAANDI